MMKAIHLYDYQLDIKLRLMEAWQSHRSVMVQMPTGTGKTHVLAAVVRSSLTPDPSPKGEGSGMQTGLSEGGKAVGTGSKVWIIAHRRELVAQIRETLGRYGINADSDVSVMSIQWLSRHWDDVEGEPSLVIIDEAHHAVAETYKEMWNRWPEARFLGLTATPCRMNRRGFTDLFDTLICSWSIAEFIEKDYLSAFDYVSIRQGSEEQRLIDSLEKRGADGDYQIKEMNERLNRDTSIERLYRSVEKYAHGKKGIVYAISIDHARRIAAYYNSKGIGTAVIDSHTPAEERRRIVEEFRRSPTSSLTNGSLTPDPSPKERGVDTISKFDGGYGGNKETAEKHITPLSFGEGSGVRLPEVRLSVLVNVDIFSEGFDCPDVEFVQMARPTLSLAKYLQQVGRGLRKSESKQACVLIDNVGLYRVFGLPTVAWDWEAMFRGMVAGKAVGMSSMRKFTEVTAIREEPAEGQEDGMEIIVSHEQLLADIGNMKNARPLQTDDDELKAWKDGESGLWGLKRGIRMITDARFVTVFDIGYGMAAVRFEDNDCGIVSDKGDVVWKSGNCQSVRFLKNGLLHVTAYNKEYYVDIYSWRSYGRRPKVNEYGNIELLEIGNVYYSRTKTVYVNSQRVGTHFIHRRNFYLTIYDEKVPFPSYYKESMSSESYSGHACILEGDNDSYYWLYCLLADGSIVIMDNARRYYHVTEGHPKTYIGCRDSEDEWHKCRAEIERMMRQAEDEWHVNESERAERRRQLLVRSEAAIPFRSGMKWGLKVGNRVTVPPIYRNVRNPVGMYCAVEKNYGQWGVISIDGMILVEPQYTDVSIDGNGTAQLTYVTGKKVSVRLQ